jgi:hypothetical protein
LLKNRAVLVIILVTVLITFCYGLTHLLVLRFKAGDVFAPYSSLRSDPLGTRALFDSLARLHPLSVRRNYEALSKWGSGHNTTLLFLGVNARSWEYAREDLLQSLEKIAAQGGRVIVSFLPVIDLPGENDRSKTPSPAPDPDKEPQRQNNPQDNIEKKPTLSQKQDTQAADRSQSSRPLKSGEPPARQQPEKPCPCASLRERWGFGFGYRPQGPPQSNNHALSTGESESEMPLPPVSWHTLLFFRDLGPSWKVIYRLYDRPVIIEKAAGSGSIVFTSDSFFVSNEALLLDRNPELLAWLIGPNLQVVFDEHHLGIIKNKGVAGLIRAFRLHWFFAGVAALAGLVIWKNAIHFVPPRPETDVSQAPLATERDHTHGLISLLRRNIPVKDILTVCVAEWKMTVDKGLKTAPEIISKIESLPELQESSSKKGIDPVSGYRKICVILSEGKKL